MKKLPIGISDYKKLIDENYYYVDKTLLIKEIYEVSAEVLLVPRPRRFGKTLNLSMIKYFFEQTKENNRYLFVDKKIWQHENFRTLQGQYPVIFLTFKDTKENSWSEAYKKIKNVISQEFAYHFNILEKNLDGHLLEEYSLIMKKTADEATYKNSLYLLSKLLEKTYKRRVIILIDEYDAPIHAGYTNKYYDQIIQFLRSFLTAGFKDNKHLQKGVLTGILRNAREGIFSGLNNLKVYSLLNETFQDKFGFTQEEIEDLIKNYKFLNIQNDIKQWYNGYKFGKVIIYNPWSLLMCIDEKGVLKSYWLNTSDNQLIKNLITLSNQEVKEDLESLIQNKQIEREIDEAIVFPNIENNPIALWSLLLFTGYLTYTSYRIEKGTTFCNLVIPNQEIEILYMRLIQDIFRNALTISKAQLLLTALTNGDIPTFKYLLQEFIINSVSMFDLPSNEPEKSYHLFILGLLVFLSDTYQVKSNRESGLGRYDIMLIPNDKNNLGIIIEFKKVALIEDLELAAKEALKQIERKRYAQELSSIKIKKILSIGIAFYAKQISIAAKEV